MAKHKGSAWEQLFSDIDDFPGAFGPLSGVKVVEAATILAAPMMSTLLSDFGAQTIKLEPPQNGDPIRSYPPMNGQRSLFHKVTNRNKLNLTLNLREAQGSNLARELIEQADVFITNFRLPTLRKWGLDYDDLKKINPRLVMVHLTAFGRTGPLADMPGFARVAEAYAGLTYISGRPGDTPMFTGYPLGDALSGYFGAFSTLLALYRQQSTGQGELVDLALYEPILRMMEDFVVGYTANGEIKQPAGNYQSYSCPSGVYPTADDKWVVIPASTAQMWARLTAVMENDDLAAMTDLQTRLDHREHIEAKLAEFTQQYKLNDIIELFRSNGIACGPVNTIEDIVQDDQIQARQNIVPVPDSATGRDLKMQSVMPKMTESSGKAWSAGRDLGQDTRQILTTLLGMTPERIEEMSQSGII